MSRKLFAPLVIVAVLAASVVTACSERMNVGENLDGSTRRIDASAHVPRTDICGNGLDDDTDARIDEGCPCGPGETQACFPGAIGARGIGTCSDGVQVCRPWGSSAEWGDWGNAPCEGATIPSDEVCDGRDHDCDGARDEDCPCTASNTRDCGAELLRAPCTAGTQRCSETGDWSGCEGAIGPTADVCDGIDNDCDGIADRGCDCEPEPERCRDGIDNDCDDETDEPACTPDWGSDGGVSSDAGGSPEAGTDAGPSCTTAHNVSEAVVGIAHATRSYPLLAPRGTGAVLLFVGARPGPSAPTVWVIDQDGTRIAEHTVDLGASFVALWAHDLVQTSTGYVALVSTLVGGTTYQYHLIALDADGVATRVVSLPTFTVESFARDYYAARLAKIGDTIVLVEGMESAARAVYYSASLNPLPLAPLALGAGRLVAYTVQRDALVLAMYMTSLGTFTVSFLDLVTIMPESSSVTRTTLTDVRAASGGSRPFTTPDVFDVGLAASPDVILACYRHFPTGNGPPADPPPPHAHRCHRVVAGVVSAPFSPLPPEPRYGNVNIDVVDIVWNGSVFVLHIERTYGATARAPYEYFVIVSSDGTVGETFPLDVVYGYGDIALASDGCVVNTVFARLVMTATPDYDSEYVWRRLCPACL